MSASVLTIVLHAGNLAALRSQASAGLVALNLATCLHSANNRALYRWAPGSTAADNGIEVVKPSDIAGGSPGRWLIVDWVETSGEGMHGELLDSRDLGPTASASSYALQVPNDWTVVGVTIEGSNRRAWLKKNVAQ